MARNRHRVIGREQLLEIGLSADQIDRRIADRRLVRRYRGVYAVGPGPLTAEGEWLAAVVFAGGDSALSHWPAAGLLRLRGWPGGIIDITAPRRVRAPRGIRAHRSPLPRDERTLRHNIPVTSTGRTVLDIAAIATVREVEKLLSEAFVLGLPLKPSLPTLLDRYPGRRGSTTVRAALKSFNCASSRTKSDLEDLLVDFLDRWGFPRPLTNFTIQTAIGPLEVDCAWPDQRLVIEVDAPSTHGSRPAMVRDRRRDRALRVAGWDPNRIMEEDLGDEDALAAEITALLDAGRLSAPEAANPGLARTRAAGGNFARNEPA